MKYLIIPLLSLIPSAAFADPIFFGSVLTSLDGKPVVECIRLNTDRTKCEEEITITLGWLSRFALDMSEDKLPLSDVIKRGNLSTKILAADKLELSVDEAKLIKDQIVKLPYKTNIKYQAIQLIDPQGVKDSK